ncbi:MAG: hypothetical protein J6V72_14920 [Kiritimatiellae bacterium]|nr:hypothetical protein [Kiritimatiellia bacterium]
MIEQKLESAIVAAVEALGVSGMDVSGLWNPVSAGFVKGEEANSSAAAGAVVRVAPRAYDAVTFPTATFDCTVSLVVRTDLDPDGAILASAADKISAFLARLHRTVAHGEDQGLDVDGLDVAAFHLTGGSGPVFDEAVATWAVTYNFTVVGVVSDATLQTTEQQEES